MAGHVDSTSDVLEDDDAGFSDDGLHERGRAKLSWTRITTTLTWADADAVLRDLACKECNGYALRERHGFSTQFGVCYRFQCGFFNYLKCARTCRCSNRRNNIRGQVESNGEGLQTILHVQDQQNGQGR